MKALLIILALVVCAQGQRANLIQSDDPFIPTSTIRLQADPLCAELRKAEMEYQASREKLIRLKGEAAVAKRPSTDADRYCASREPLKLEEGSLDGVVFRFYYSDGSGFFAGDSSNSLTYGDSWSVGCKKDAITDEKSCHLGRGDIRVWIDGSGRSELYIGGEHYPGSYVVIRIDNSRPAAFVRARSTALLAIAQALQLSKES